MTRAMVPVDPADLSSAPPGWEDELLRAIEQYDRDDPYYDEVFCDTSRRIRQRKEASKADIAAITFWKRSAQGAWTGKLLALPDQHVREVTREAFAADGDAAKLRALAPLPGFKGQNAIPTALLCAFDPAEFAVMDRRAHNALGRWGLGVGQQRGVTLRYLKRVRAIREHLRPQREEIMSREVDKGLFVLGG